MTNTRATELLDDVQRTIDELKPVWNTLPLNVVSDAAAAAGAKARRVYDDPTSTQTNQPDRRKRE